MRSNYPNIRLHYKTVISEVNHIIFASPIKQGIGVGWYNLNYNQPTPF